MTDLATWLLEPAWLIDPMRGYPGRSFWDLVTKESGSTDACWTWAGTRNPQGYGSWKNHQLAHRVSLSISLGRAILPGMYALHHCDTPPCVNPDHLYEGNASQNGLDAVRRGLLVHANTRKVECQNGHPLAGGNLIQIRHSATGRLSRRCRICDNARKAASARRVRAQRKERTDA